MFYLAGSPIRTHCRLVRALTTDDTAVNAQVTKLLEARRKTLYNLLVSTKERINDVELCLPELLENRLAGYRSMMYFLDAMLRGREAHAAEQTGDFPRASQLRRQETHWLDLARAGRDKLGYTWTCPEYWTDPGGAPPKRSHY